MEENKENSENLLTKPEENSETKPEQSEEEIVAEKTKYFASLRSWLYRAHMAHANAYLPYYVLATQLPFQPSGPFLNNNYQSQWLPYQPMSTYRNQRNAQGNLQRNGAGNRPQNNANPNRNEGLECTIPPIWKRLVAEFCDFLFILFTKVLFTFILVDYLDLIKLEKYNILVSKTTTFHLVKQMAEDYDFIIELSSDLIFFEIINRIGACIFEAIFLADTFGTFGATPGKLIMGLSVVYATSVTPVENRPRETVLVYPATNLSFGVAFARSAVKNALITIIFPMCLFTIFFQHNRTTYDLICNVIVIESNRNEQRARVDARN